MRIDTGKFVCLVRGSFCLSSCVETKRFCLPVSEGCGVCRAGRVVGFVLS